MFLLRNLVSEGLMSLGGDQRGSVWEWPVDAFITRDYEKGNQSISLIIQKNFLQVLSDHHCMEIIVSARDLQKSKPGDFHSFP